MGEQDAPWRILAVHSNPDFLEKFERGFRAERAQITCITDATRVVPVARDLEPHLLVVERTLPGLDGAEIIRSLHSFAETEQIPVVLTLDNGSEAEVLRALHAGASDVLTLPFVPAHVARLLALIEAAQAKDPSAPAQPESVLLQTLLKLYRREERHGALVVNQGTPFEGRAAFDRGELVSAHYGPLDGLDALREMLELEDGVWRFHSAALDGSAVSDDDEKEAPAAGHGATPYRPQVLIVDDEPALRRMYEKQFGKAGFDTAMADDGERAYEAAVLTAFDVIVADLHMPRLDGWGLLQKLKADPRTREIPLILISGHDDYRETLKVARAGAYDYLPKTGRADPVVPSMLALMGPRMDFWAHLGGPGKVEVFLYQIGVLWCLRALAATQATGMLEVRDEWGDYTLSVEDGIPLEAQAALGRRQLDGRTAVNALVACAAGQGTFTTQAVKKGPPLADSMLVLLRETGDSLRRLDAEGMAAKLLRAPRFDVDEILYALYRRVGSNQGVRVARAVIDQSVALSDLSSTLDLSPSQVQRALTELLERGVLRFAADHTPLLG